MLCDPGSIPGNRHAEGFKTYRFFCTKKFKFLCQATIECNLAMNQVKLSKINKHVKCIPGLLVWIFNKCLKTLRLERHLGFMASVLLV